MFNWLKKKPKPHVHILNGWDGYWSQCDCGMRWNGLEWKR